MLYSGFPYFPLAITGQDMGDKTIGNDLDNAEISFSKDSEADSEADGDAVGPETRSGYRRMPYSTSTLESKMENTPLPQMIQIYSDDLRILT